MYKDFYDLGSDPFPKSMPTGSRFMAESQEEAVSRLVYVAERRMFAVVTGDCGCGKTTVLRTLRDSLDDKEYQFLYQSDSRLTPCRFYNGLLWHLGLEGSNCQGDSRRRLHREIELIRGLHHRGLVVVVDDAHLLEREMLEEIRFLLNFKMDAESPLAVILSGQPELEERLFKAASAAVGQRVDFRCRLSPLSLAETGAYIGHHLRRAGKDGPLFTDSAVKAISSYSVGSARLINKACVCCMIYGASKRMDVLDKDVVNGVIDSELRWPL